MINKSDTYPWWWLVSIKCHIYSYSLHMSQVTTPRPPRYTPVTGNEQPGYVDLVVPHWVPPRWSARHRFRAVFSCQDQLVGGDCNMFYVSIYWEEPARNWLRNFGGVCSTTKQSANCWSWMKNGCFLHLTMLVTICDHLHKFHKLSTESISIYPWCPWLWCLFDKLQEL